MDKADMEFFKKYHVAVVKANSKQVEKLKSRIGSEWAEDFREMAQSLPEGTEFDRALEEYLNNQLRFADRVKVEGSPHELNVEVKGCRICHGNEVLKAQGEPALCPLVPMGLFSISRVAGRKATLDEVRKNGVVGECRICYKMS
jgi:putative intracellular protease/amidase